MDMTGKLKDAKADNIIWYKNAAGCWEETLPIGNGSLGAMIWGTPDFDEAAYMKFLPSAGIRRADGEALIEKMAAGEMFHK